MTVFQILKGLQIFCFVRKILKRLNHPSFSSYR